MRVVFFVGQPLHLAFLLGVQLVKKLKENAESSPNGSCGRYVRYALEAGYGMGKNGLHGKTPGAAKDYHLYLGKKKFYFLEEQHQSTGLQNTRHRINIINTVYKKNYHVEISDLNQKDTGTKVVLTLA